MLLVRVRNDPSKTLLQQQLFYRRLQAVRGPIHRGRRATDTLLRGTPARLDRLVLRCGSLCKR